MSCVRREENVNLVLLNWLNVYVINQAEGSILGKNTSEGPSCQSRLKCLDKIVGRNTEKIPQKLRSL